MSKAAVRSNARERRRALQNAAAGQRLVESFPASLTQSIIAGFAPFGDEIDLWPLLGTLHDAGRQICLPVVTGSSQPLAFRPWTPHCEMTTDRYGVSCPAQGPFIAPELILVPLLAFTSQGHRLGYGGGYYDRTLEALRSRDEVFACGVAYAGQEVTELPTDEHDQPLDAILTEDGFRIF